MRNGLGQALRGAGDLYSEDREGRGLVQAFNPPLPLFVDREHALGIQSRPSGTSVAFHRQSLRDLPVRQTILLPKANHLVREVGLAAGKSRREQGLGAKNHSKPHGNGGPIVFTP